MIRDDSASSEEEGVGGGLLTLSPIPTQHSRGKGRSHGKTRADLSLDEDGDNFYAGGVKTEFSKSKVGPRASSDLSAGWKSNSGDTVRGRPTGLYKTDLSPGGPSILYRSSNEDDGFADTEVDAGECSEDTCSEGSSEVMLQNGVAVDRPRRSENVGDRAVLSGQVDALLTPPPDPGWGGRSDWLQEMVAKEIASSEWAAERRADETGREKDEEEAGGEYGATLNQGAVGEEDLVLDMESVLIHESRSAETSSHASPSGFRVQDHPLSGPNDWLRPGGVAARQLSSVASVESWGALRVEVVGSRQVKGEVSFADRAVGIKEHTLYLIRVEGPGMGRWTAERRFRDFLALYRRLLKRGGGGGWLPPPWDQVGVEGQKYFGGNSRAAVESRRVLMQGCFNAVAGMGEAAVAVAVAEFLDDPQLAHPSGSGGEGGAEVGGGAREGMGRGVGSSIRLVVEEEVGKPLTQQLHIQRYMCAGCYRRLDHGSSLASLLLPLPSLTLSLSLPLSHPRLCCYTSRLFCGACHAGDVALIPARVLQHWDFAPRKVSLLARAYLDSIYDQPLLCVSAVNPYLYTRVPVLGGVQCLRKRVAKLQASLKCPAMTAWVAGGGAGGLGQRRYLMADTDFYAMKDLADLSLGTFAVLPLHLERLAKRLEDHVVHTCATCRAGGTPCGAGPTCGKGNLIFPFQTDRKSCGGCGALFHASCFAQALACRACTGEPDPPFTSLQQTPSGGVGVQGGIGPPTTGMGMGMGVGGQWLLDGVRRWGGLVGSGSRASGRAVLQMNSLTEHDDDDPEL